MSWGQTRMGEQLARYTARSWWVPLVRGLILLLVGLALLLAPLTSLAAVVTVLGVGALADGVVSVVLGIAGRGQWGAGWRVVRGAIGVLAGLFLIWQPSISAKSLVVLAGIAGLVTGVVMIAVSVQTRALAPSTWSGGLVAGGLLALLGTFLIVFPSVALLVATVSLGIGALLVGAALVAHGWRLRREWKQLARL
ncbi:uncharacterized membrane protein HdeD (DUF308 family) [Georgenia soli]|uniref:Uncharacterized membrane protein HdeD (DUF308 family) n=1 Tax=Georgenia soli TaxID=638953 RepID=A0A2A9EP52_9MICO|nr:DUF308 domain-containing protein [Georgenia soli]PFG39999.1 uncharacterized membrane protein HdeD (DUF308 family) [Georgenia soli]